MKTVLLVGSTAVWSPWACMQVSIHLSQASPGLRSRPRPAPTCALPRGVFPSEPDAKPQARDHRADTPIRDPETLLHLFFVCLFVFLSFLPVSVLPLTSH